MIERYSRKVMRDVWTEQNKFSAYLEVEILSCEAWSELGVIPKEDVEKIRAAATFDVDRIKEIEEITRHDVVAFTRAVSESLGPERKWVHYGLTSTDVVDTANGYLLKQADEILLKDLEAFLEVLKRRALEFKDTPCIGRTHGVHADITSFGLKWALWHEEMKRNIERFQYARKGVEAGKMSGAVGNFANIPPFIQDYVDFVDKCLCHVLQTLLPKASGRALGCGTEQTGRRSGGICEGASGNYKCNHFRWGLTDELQ